MSLLVWLPLLGNLNNQGTSNVTVTNNGASVDNNGKLGKCYSFNGSSNYINISNLPNPANLTVSFWMLRSANTGTRQFMFTAWTGVTCELTTDNKIVCTCYGNGANQGSCTYTDQAITTSSGWVHVTYTFEDKVGGKLYVNGNLVKSSSSSQSIAWSTTSGKIGYYSTYFNGKINDFRFYDEVLSAKQIREIAKGLVAHYPLNGPGAQENLFRATSMTAEERTSSGFVANSSTDWTKYFRYYNGSSSNHSFSGDTDNITLSSGSNIGIAFVRKATDINLDSNSYYTISCEAKCSTAGAHLDIGLSYYNNSNSWIWRGGSNAQNFAAIDNWQKFTLTFKPDADTQYICYCFTVNNTGTFSIRHCKLEKGNISSSWMPNSADVNYTTMGYNSTTEYDTSGYGYNGTRSGTITSNLDTAKYGISSQFASNSHIALTLVTGGYANSYTFSWWGKYSNYSGHMMWGFSNGNRLNLYMSNGYFYWNTGDGRENPFNVSALTYGDNKWHHFAITGDGTTTKLYIDGVFKNNATTYKAITGTTIYMNGWYSSTEYNFNGSLSDFRLYATALSADDVKELYQTSASIDNKGNIYSLEFKEV